MGWFDQMRVIQKFDQVHVHPGSDGSDDRMRRLKITVQVHILSGDG
jgi:hypothetical protein